MKRCVGFLIVLLSFCASNSRAQEVELGISREDALTFYAAHNFTMHSHKPGDSVLFSIDVDSVTLWGIRGAASLIFNPRELMVGSCLRVIRSSAMHFRCATMACSATSSSVTASHAPPPTPAVVGGSMRPISILPHSKIRAH